MSEEDAAAGRSAIELRPLVVADLDAVIAIDRKQSGRSRRGFYEKRLESALREPKRFIYVGACEDGRLAGFAFARLLKGEFGGASAVAELDAIGVDPDARGRGLGRALMSGLGDVMRVKGVREMRSQVDWTDHDLVRFLDAAGFSLSRRVVLVRPVAEPFAA